MKLQRLWLQILGFATVLVVCAGTLLAAAYNRSGIPESTLRLSERELELPAGQGSGAQENTPLTLHLAWRVESTGHVDFGGNGRRRHASRVDYAIEARPTRHTDAESSPTEYIRLDAPGATVLHGHMHQILTNRIGNIDFHGMLSTAWPWPYAPQGLPMLTVQMNRPNPFDSNDGLGDGQVIVHPDGLVDKVYGLWNRNPAQVKASYLSSGGKQDLPAPPTLASY